MPRRPGPRATHDPNKAQLMTLDPALALLAAVLQQAVHDARSPRHAIREDALQFLQDPDSLAWFGQQLGVEDALQRQVQALLDGDA